MYGLVLATMMTVGTATPGGHWHKHGCHGGCHGCWGNAFSSCYGCAGCWGCGGGCGGCYGGSCYGGGGAGCYGGGGSCYGGGCWGSGAGCYGGGAGCYGSGAGCYGGSGAGCYGGSGYWGGSSSYGSSSAGEEVVEGETVTQTTRAASKVVARVPADAVLFVDGMKINQASAVRTLVTPELPAGRTYAYTFKVEAVRDGRTVTLVKDVAVRAGQTTQVSFDDLGQPTPVAAQVTVTLPVDAKLYIENTLLEKTGAVRSFTTPPLEPGRKFAYTLRAEVQRDGQKRSQRKEVTVEAGKPASVEFGEFDAATVSQR